MNFFRISHLTRYSYSSTVIDCTNQIMLYPIIDAHLEVRKHDLKITHNPLVEVFVDYFGNRTGVFSIIQPHKELVIESIVHVITKPVVLPDDDKPAKEQWEYLNASKTKVPYMDFITREAFPSSTEAKDILSNSVNPDATPFQTAQALSDYVYNNFIYQKGITNVESPIEDVWQLKGGVCQDFAHILLVFLRMFNIPARYVSGYICPKDREMRGEGATHAWVEAYVPWYGWIGLDPTNNCVVSDRHVRLAVGRNFNDCTPVKGTYKGSGEHTLEVTVEIDNGTPKKPQQVTPDIPVFAYEVKKPGVQINSYRRFIEVQQQQQQQQQQKQIQQ